MRVFGFAGFSGSGKTTLIEKLVPLLVSRGQRVSLIKHAHHAFDVDRPGKDSYPHRQAGCGEVLVSSSQRWALMHELRGAPEPPTLATTLPHFGLEAVEEIARFVLGSAARVPGAAPHLVRAV